MFSIRNRMINIKSNFKQRRKEENCICGDIETMEHIWNCKLSNTEIKQNEKYENIFNGNLTQQIIRKTGKVHRIEEKN